MNQDVVVNIVVQMMSVGLKVAMPLMLVGLVVGLAVSVFQAVTQIQEQTLSFIPKVAALVVMIVVLGPWMLGQILTWTNELWSAIPSLAVQ
jgi:flagellar biosynthetic protein FliQ